ncbi:Kelch repeat-containing protein [Sphingobacterium sp. HJSM2_6]|uniref:Kelch repeat-containing protein n=1 Tax=Sphingobacterium sp. HJSM2_6 TaxID=3366264 RepID=UPI003BE9C8EA
MNKRNWLVLLLVGAFAIASFNSCKKEDETSTETGPTEWTRTTAFEGENRNGAASFTINNTAYVVGGYIKTNASLNDNYSFNGSSWVKKADFTGSKRHNAVGFSVDGKGYVGLGYGTKDDGTQGELNDFYSYDPTANTWSKIKEFPGDARFGATAFTLNGKAYVGLGTTSTDKSFSDFYEYDPQSNIWKQLTNTKFPFKKAYAYAFVIDNIAYVGGGLNNGQPADDLFSFNGTDWTALENTKTDEYDARRYNSSTFVIGKFGYLVSGRSSSGIVSTVWKFDPATKTWTDKHEAFGSVREKAVAFGLNGKGYITTGTNGSTFFDDTWEFTPVR